MILNVYSCSPLVTFTSFHSWILTATTGRSLETVQVIRARERQSFTVCHWKIPSLNHCRRSLTRITLDWWLVWQREGSILCKIYFIMSWRHIIFAHVVGVSVSGYCRSLTHITLDCWLVWQPEDSKLCNLYLNLNYLILKRKVATLYGL